MNSQFAALDWIVVGIYLIVMLGGGWAFARLRRADTSEYFLAGHTIPAWLAAVSVLAATQSAATFLGAPDQGFRGDLTYLGAVVAPCLSALFVAYVLIPRFYAMRVTTVYELLEHRYDARAMRAAGAMFLVGRVLAGGARVYLAAIALAMVAFSSVSAPAVLTAAACVMLAAFLFTFHGGLKAVIWNDLIQFIIFVGSAVAVLVFLRLSIPATNAEILSALAQAPNGANKLRLFDFSLDLSHAFSVPAILTGLFLLNTASGGLDQDVTQRLLASPDAKTGARGLILSALGSIPIIAVFLTIGLLLHIFYERPELMGAANQAAATFEGEKVTVFVHYILTQIPPGLRGLVTIGVMAAAVATTNSALNAMSSVMVTDFYRPWRARQGKPADEAHLVHAGRWGMGLVAIAMFGAAALSFYWQRYTDMPLLEFALQVMVFAYAGLLGVYFVAIFTTRGTTASVIAALVAGFVTVLVLQPFVIGPIGLAFPFQLCIGTLVAGLVCAIPGKSSR